MFTARSVRRPQWRGGKPSGAAGLWPSRTARYGHPIPLEKGPAPPKDIPRSSPFWAKWPKRRVSGNTNVYGPVGPPAAMARGEAERCRRPVAIPHCALRAPNSFGKGSRALQGCSLEPPEKGQIFLSRGFPGWGAARERGWEEGEVAGTTAPRSPAGRRTPVLPVTGGRYGGARYPGGEWATLVPKHDCLIICNKAGKAAITKGVFVV